MYLYTMIELAIDQELLIEHRLMIYTEIANHIMITFLLCFPISLECVSLLLCKWQDRNVIKPLALNGFTSLCVVLRSLSYGKADRVYAIHNT